MRVEAIRFLTSVRTKCISLHIEKGALVQGIRGLLPNNNVLGSFISCDFGRFYLYGDCFNFYFFTGFDFYFFLKKRIGKSFAQIKVLAIKPFNPALSNSWLRGSFCSVGYDNGINY